MSLDIRSPMDLVYECFAKLGLRYICVLRDGRYAGMVRYHARKFWIMTNAFSFIERCL